MDPYVIAVCSFVLGAFVFRLKGWRKMDYTEDKAQDTGTEAIGDQAPARRPNTYVGRFLIEKVPEDRQPFTIYRLDEKFLTDCCSSFSCYTFEEAVELIGKLKEAGQA